MGRGEEVEWLKRTREYINKMKCRSVKYIVTNVIKYIDVQFLSLWECSK